jgi:hypothetical protein
VIGGIRQQSACKRTFGVANDGASDGFVAAAPVACC